jgi:hypothetical protein
LRILKKKKVFITEIKEKINEIEAQFEELVEKVADDIDIQSKNLKLESNPQIGYYFRVSRKVKKTKKNNIISALYHDRSQSASLKK